MNHRMRIKLLPVLLWLLSIAGIFFALKTSNDPIVGVFRNTRIEPLFRQISTGNSVIFGLSIGFLVSVIFYTLVVWYPERQRKKLIRRNFEEQYRHFKEDTIAIFLLASTNGYDGDLPKRLSDQREFRKYFKERVDESQTRWDSVLNGLNKEFLKDLLVELEILLSEVTFVLNNINIDDRNVFGFFKGLLQTVYRLKNITPNEDVKQLSQFLWQLFAGWSSAEGYREYDIVEEMIKGI